jgi:hypothetical protein
MATDQGTPSSPPTPLMIHTLAPRTNSLGSIQASRRTERWANRHQRAMPPFMSQALPEPLGVVAWAVRVRPGRA